MVNPEKFTGYVKSRYGSFYKYSRALGISRATISRYLGGSRLPSFIIAKKIVNESDGYITFEDIYGQDQYLGQDDEI